MVFINLKGGLGNQLFQYAAALAIAKARKQELVFDVSSFSNDPYQREYSLAVFKVDNRVCSRWEISKVLPHSYLERFLDRLRVKTDRRNYSLDALEMDLSILNSFPKHQYLDGYFANSRYFQCIRNELVKNISLKSIHKTDLFKEKIKWIKQNNFVSIHIRRSDYISDSVASKLFVSLDKDYYKGGMHYFQSELNSAKKFLFFSDDLKWAKSEFGKLENAFFIEEAELYKDYYDLMFMAACEHNIIANSTFSWWGAWLNQNPNKKVLAPKRWYRNEVYQDFYERSKFIPDEWKLL